MDHQDVDRSHLGKAEYARVDRSRLGKGEYADYFEVGHDFVAFYVDCGQQAVYGKERTRVYSRIVTSPLGAINLIGVLAKALCEYAGRYHAFRNDEGEILPDGKAIEELLCDYTKRFVPEYDKRS
jgi:hypothetical protein